VFFGPDVLVLLAVWVGLGFAGGAIGRSKGMENSGFLLGLLLGPIGLIIIAVTQPSQERRDQVARKQGMVSCPHCNEFVRPGASVCRHCQHEMAVT
jgi:hypothetical protein